MMLREGMAVVYESGGAEYGPWGIEGMKTAQRQAEYVYPYILLLSVS